jgi:hypothetical protein
MLWGVTVEAEAISNVEYIRRSNAMKSYVCGSRIKIIKNGINTLKSTYKKQGKKYVDISGKLVDEIYLKFKLGPGVVPKTNTEFSEPRMVSRENWKSFIKCVTAGEIYKLYKINGKILDDDDEKILLKRFGF